MTLQKQLDKLVAGINPRARLPKGFALWSTKLQIMWLQQHQRKEPNLARPT